jgi:hypothetical protein
VLAGMSGVRTSSFIDYVGIRGLRCLHRRPGENADDGVRSGESEFVPEPPPPPGRAITPSPRYGDSRQPADNDHTAKWTAPTESNPPSFRPSEDREGLDGHKEAAGTTSGTPDVLRTTLGHLHFKMSLATEQPHVVTDVTSLDLDSHLIKQAAQADKQDHELGLWDAVKQHKTAVMFSMIMSASLIMEGYE